MNQDRHNRVGELFLAARGMDSACRKAYLHEACADDPSLGREVESLLEADGEETLFLAAESVSHQGANALLESRQKFIGTKLGRYTIRKVIGAGGMGTV